MCSDSTTLRKQVLELAALQLASQPHRGAIFDVALLIVKAGELD